MPGIKSVTNQIRKINAESCEMYHKMSGSESGISFSRTRLFWSSRRDTVISRYRRSVQARELLKFMKQRFTHRGV